jgi:16S rRNA (guanine527-N7)-methyltransferase
MSEAAPQPDFGPEQFLEAARVSRETLAHLELYVGALCEWNGRHNLVSQGSLADVWRRHVWDSAQLAQFVPEGAKTLADLGSGAGFPGLVLAELLRDRVQVTLYEATTKKCGFLEAAAATMALKVTIRNERIEDAKAVRFDVVTARAMAPLPKLLRYAQKFVGKGTVCLFPKGQNVDAELTEARKSWKLQVRKHPSMTDPSGVILDIRELQYVRR